MKLAKPVLATVTTALAMVFAAGTAQAAVIIDVKEVGGDVVFSAAGSLDLAGASSAGAYNNYGHGFIAGGSNWYVAPGPGGPTKAFAFTSFDGPFGTSLSYFSSPSSFSGDDFFIWGQGGGTAQVGVSVGYVSGGAIASEMVFSGTIAGFTMIPGPYTYTLPHDTILLNIGAPVPEPTTGLLLGLGALSLLVRRRRASR